jgi:hypothetical protein
MDMDYSSEDYEDDMKLAYYIEIGAVEVAGVAEDGEMIFAISEDAKEIAPELWESHMEYVDKTLLDLYEKDLINIEYDENLEATITLSEEGFKIARERGVLPIDMPEIPDN